MASLTLADMSIKLPMTPNASELACAVPLERIVELRNAANAMTMRLKSMLTLLLRLAIAAGPREILGATGSRKQEKMLDGYKRSCNPRPAKREILRAALTLFSWRACDRSRTRGCQFAGSVVRTRSHAFLP